MENTFFFFFNFEGTLLRKVETVLALDRAFLKKPSAEVHDLCCLWHGSTHHCPAPWPWHCTSSFMKDHDLRQQSPDAEELNQFPGDDG